MSSLPAGNKLACDEGTKARGSRHASKLPREVAEGGAYFHSPLSGVRRTPFLAFTQKAMTSRIVRWIAANRKVCEVAGSPSHQFMMMRTLVVATMLASASSFAPSPKTQLATPRPAQAPPRVMPAMKLTPGNPLYYIGFPSQCQKDDEIREVCPYHCAPLEPIASLELLASLDSCAPGAPRLPGAPSPP